MEPDFRIIKRCEHGVIEYHLDSGHGKAPGHPRETAEERRCEARGDVVEDHGAHRVVRWARRLLRAARWLLGRPDNEHHDQDNRVSMWER